jgi:lipase maturation factor 1
MPPPFEPGTTGPRPTGPGPTPSFASSLAPSLARLPRWLLASDPNQTPSRLLPRWIFLRALGLIFFSAFYSLLFQAQGLIGPDGLLPAGAYLEAVREAVGSSRFWYAPSLLWLGSGERALTVLVWTGIIASVLLVLNVWPSAMVAICVVVFMSFISTLQAFSSYQSDGMLLGAGFLCLFFAPPGLWPGLGARHPAPRASLFMLLWLWFTIYFESGLVKIASGDPEWRHLTAMDQYYQNGPLPTWIAWYVQHFPHWFHVGTAGLTLLLELVLAWMLFLPRPFRIVLFWIVTPWQIGIILTSNYAFLNYLVLALGFLLLDDRYMSKYFLRWMPKRFATSLNKMLNIDARESGDAADAGRSSGRQLLNTAQVWIAGFFLGWIFYATAIQMILIVFPMAPLPLAPAEFLEPFRIADRYGLFATMTPARYEVEFQGTYDGQTWTAYPFRYKPQDPSHAPGIYAPYQPRFEWNLWFASLDTWQRNRFVVSAEEHLLENTPAVLTLFSSNPFPSNPPRQVRAVIWQYWFTDEDEKRQGLWWRRTLLGLYAPTIERGENGTFTVVAMPEPSRSNPTQ